MTRALLTNAVSDAPNRKGGEAETCTAPIQDLTMLKVAENRGGGKIEPLFSEAHVLDARRATAWLADRIATAAKLPPSEFLSEVVAVTPALAEIILTRHNSGNRPIKPHAQASYAEAMRDGRWKLHSKGISFSRDGILNDGQHRLAAVVDSGCTVTMNVTFGEDRSVFDVLDTGKVRGGSDTLHVRGYKNTAVLAAAARLLLIVTGSSPRGNHTFPNDIIAQTVSGNVGLEGATTIGQHVAKKLRSSTAATTAAFYLISTHSAFSRRLDAFASHLATGTELTSRDPILVLREGLKDKTIGMKRMAATEECAAIIYAWNLWVRGRKATLASLRWQPGSPFPTAE